MAIGSERAPGTSDFYRKIYSNLGESTLHLDSKSPPSTAVGWFKTSGLIDAHQPLSALEIGCGAGRNFKRIHQCFPRATLFGFEGSPVARSLVKQAYPEYPEENLVFGDVHGEWPFPQEFDVIFDITVGIPESRTLAELNRYAVSLYKSLKPGGYAVIEAITPEDASSKRFPTDKTDNAIVLLQLDDETKPERLMTSNDAEAFYKNHGFILRASRLESFLGTAFGEKDLEREFFQLIIQKPEPVR